MQNINKNIVFIFLLILMTQVGLFAARTTLVNPSPNYKLKFVHSGSENYSFTLRNADGTTLSTSEVGIEHTTEMQGVCQALVVTNQSGTTFTYNLSWSTFKNGASSIPYALRLTRSSILIADVPKTTHSYNLTLPTRESGIGNRTYELCTIYITLDSEASAAAASGRYTDNLTFTLTPDA